MNRQSPVAGKMADAMDRMVSQEVVVTEDPLDAAMIRKSLRPVLILSRRNLSEHRTFIRHLLVGLADESIPVALVCPPGQNIEALVPVPAAVFTHPAIDRICGLGYGYTVPPGWPNGAVVCGPPAASPGG